MNTGGKSLNLNLSFSFQVISPQISIFNSLKIATDYYGKYGPQEWWIMGDDENSKSKLISEFCERRVERSQDIFWTEDGTESCFDNLTRRWENGGTFYSRRSKYFGYLHIVMYLNRPYAIPEMDHVFIDTVVHEYTHAVQHSLNNNPLVPELGNKPVGWGSPFFTEGAAVYYGEYIPRKLNNQGLNIEQEFLEFLELPIEQQLEIIPDI